MWILFALVYVVTYIVFLQLFKVVSKRTTNIGALTIVIQIIAALSLIVFSPLYEWVWPTNWLPWFLYAIALVFFAVNDRLDATCRKNIDISVDGMLQQVYRLFWFAGGVIFISGIYSFSWTKLLGGLIIVAVNMFLLFDKDKFKPNKYMLLKILSAIFFAAAFTLENSQSLEFNLPFMMFLSFIVPATYLLISRTVLFVWRKQSGIWAAIHNATFGGLWREVKRREWWIILLCGFAQAASAFAIIRAYQFRDHFMEVAAICATYVILNVFFAYFFLKEKQDLFKKIIAAIIISCCIAIIALG